MPLAFHTARMGYTGPDPLDISRKSGGALGLCFAPSWDLLKPYLDKRKAGALTDEDWTAYRGAFLDEMRASYQRHRRAWAELLGQRHAVLTCYCPDPGRCHRGLVAWCLLQMGAEYLGELDRDGTKPEHVAVVGSRPPKDDASPGEHETWARRIVPAVTAAVRALPGNVVLVSGGAPGVDQIAEREGKDLRRIILPAAWRQKGRQAGLIRNGWVSRVADRALAFPSSWGRGTQHLIGLMERVVRKPVEVFTP